MHIRYSAVILFTLLSFSLLAQNPRWIPMNSTDLERIDVSGQQIIPNEYKVFSMDFEALEDFLQLNQSTTFSLEIPFPDGTIQKFTCEKATLIPDGLQTKYPSILSFDGKGETIRGSSMKFGISPKGFHAMVLLQGSSPVFIDIISQGMTSYYMSYYKENYEPQQIFTCDFQGEDKLAPTYDLDTKSFAGDCQLRSYRLALACTGEYTQFHGGTVETTLAEYAIAMARVNGIYEKDLGITMIFIDNTDEVIYLDSATDPYTNNSGGVMLGENQATLDDIIGTENYDIGHVFSTGGGGIASLQSPCNNNRKAQGVTGLPSPINDPFYVDYVSHEMGHQFGANHTQNNDCNRVASTAMEVGSANTIMGYAGICAPNSKNNSDDHFHAISIVEITNYIVNGNGNSCTELVEVDNTQPTVNLDQLSYNVPKDTPFMLTANANDSDGDVMTYCWEQMDNEFANMPPELTNTGGPAFISNSPLLSPTRVFPNMDAIVNNQFPTWEVLPNVARLMNFRVTVRDNKNLLGCTAEADVLLDVDGESGPFLVEQPNTNVVWMATEEEVVEWDVANTDGGDVNCALVDILLSTDGGYNYPITLAEQVPNDGSHTIIVPGEFTSTARVMVKCSDNVFFDISNTNFSIETSFSFAFSQEDITICEGEGDVIEISTEGFEGFAEEISFTVEGEPAGLEYTFSNNPVNPSESTTLNLTNNSIEPGEYSFTVLATASGISIPKTVNITVQPSSITGLNLLLPENGAVDINLSTTLMWDNVPGINSYEITLSKSPSFTNPITVIANSGTSIDITNLEGNTVYYWKVTANSICLQNGESDLSAFQTQRDGICNLQASADIPLEIPEDEVGVFSSTLEVSDISSYDYMECYIDLEHTYLGDIIFTLVSPEGTELILMDQLGEPESMFGCSTDDIAVTFSDLSINLAELLEQTCSDFEANYQPVDLFETIINEDVNGEWTLLVEDVFNQDGGQVVNWDLKFCAYPDLGDVNLVNEVLIVPFNNEREISVNELQVEIDEPFNSSFTLLSTPANGDLRWENPDGIIEVLGVGSTFTQADINQGKVVYAHNGNNETTDSFRFDAIDALNRWTHNQQFNIIILSEGEAFVIPNTENLILCFGEETASLEVEVLNGNGPFMYSIDGGENFVSDSIFNNLGAGEYDIVVQDVNGFEIYNESYDIDEPIELIATATSEFYDIIVNGSGGTEGYTYSINGLDFFDSSIFEDIDPGVYTVTVKDANGCESTVDVNHAYDALSNQFDIIDNICFGDSTGIINISTSGGFAPYTYSLDGTNYQELETFENLIAGTYSVYVKDAGGLIISYEITVFEGGEITFILNGNEDNFSVEDVAGGEAPFEYSLDNINYVDSPVFDPLPDGDFTVYVSDVNGCTKSLEYIEIDGQIESSLTLCVDDPSGSFSANATGGFPPYSYSIDGVNFQDSETFTDLAADTYTLIIRDNFGFQNTVEVTINDPDPITVTTEFISGQLIITATGGTGTYMYSIDGGLTFQSGNTFDIDITGNYPIVVIDSNDCIDETMLTLNIVNNKDIALDDLIKIYPVPVYNNLMIELDPSISENTRFKIYNIVGQEMDFIPLQSGNEFTIDFSEWTQGQYVLTIQSEETTITKKILKF